MPSPIEKYPRAPYNRFRDAREPGGLNDLLARTTPGKITKTFDEPTYLTFRLNFTDENNNVESTNFDKMPMPLFNRYNVRDGDDLRARNYYSSQQYLRDINEMVRSQMMQDFIEGWNELQSNNQWYFQEINGLDNILPVNPEKGMRVSRNDGRLTFKMLEGLDLRVTHLLDIYRKIAWDDTYQRWILPDLMRFFKLNIYITEFRSFHRSNRFNVSPGRQEPLILELMRNFTPVYVIECERCEFDINSIRKIPDSLNVGDPQMREVEFSIKVGNLRERYINPILNYFYYDVITNGFDRSKDSIDDPDSIFPENPTRLSDTNNPNINPVLSDYAKGDILANEDHESGKPFIQSGYVDNIKNSSPNYNVDVDSVNPTDPATWSGNALNFGKAFVENFVESRIDEAKLQKIPGLGISFNEALAALESKNVFTVFGTVRRALSENVTGTFPSSELEENFIDTQFKDFLQGVADSEATDENAVKMQEAANMVLSDNGQWEKIKDLSRATDLVSNALGEINSLNEIQNRNVLKQIYNQEYIPTDIQGGIIYEGVPSSASTTGGDLEGKQIQQPEVGRATADDNPQIESGTRTELGSTDGKLEGGSTISPSAELDSNAGESLERPDDGLGSVADDGYDTVKPSENLGSNAGEGLERPNDGLGSVADDGYDTVKPSENLGSDAGSSLDQPESGLGERAEGGLHKSKPSKDLGSDAGEKLSKPGSGLGNKIEGEPLSRPEPGEAVDDDPIKSDPLQKVSKSKATNSKIEK